MNTVGFIISIVQCNAFPYVFERAEEQDEGQLELEESVEIRERACDESVGSHTEREIPEDEEDEEENEGDEEEG